LNSSLEIPVIKSNKSKMYELISYEKFRDTKDVRFFDIRVNQSNYRDLVIHSGLQLVLQMMKILIIGNFTSIIIKKIIY